MFQPDHRRAFAPGFTLVELLVVVAIIALLIAILLPSLDKARRSARSIVEQTQMRQILIGMRLYADDYSGRLCPNSQKFTEITWQGNTRTNVWVNWSSEPLIGRYFGNKAITCSAIWPPPQLVSEILYCPELSRKDKTFTQYKDMPWKSGIGMNASYSAGLPLNRIGRPASLGLLACTGYNNEPSDSWSYITTPSGSIDFDINFVDRTSTAHNTYRHLSNTNIAFADGHTATTADAVADQRNKSLLLKE